MQDNIHKRSFFHWNCSVLIWIFLSGIYAYVWMNLYAVTMTEPFFRRGHWLIVALYVFVLTIFTKIYGGYRIGDLRITEIIYSHGLSLALTNTITYTQICLLTKRIESPLPLLLMTLVQMAVVVIWAITCNKLFFIIFPARKLLLVYGGDGTDDILFKMARRPEKYNIQEEIDIAEGLGKVFARMVHYSSVILCDIPSPQRNDLLKFCFDQSIRTYLTPKISDIIVRGAETIQLFDTPLLLNKNRGLQLGQSIVKRIMDILLSASVMLLASPIFLAVAIAIKLEDGGPIFYQQRRLTIDEKEFTLHKFRSMVTDAEKDGVAQLAAHEDSRITKVGKFIRALRLDELPQLWNILKGDMSIVGPRPERPEIVDLNLNEIPEFSYRLKAKAGLTGYAQVMGRYNTSIYDKLKLDLMYIQNYSLLLDLKIIFMTVKILFMKESTQGFTENKSQMEVNQ